MKLSKILFGAVAVAAVMGLVSCGGDDPNGMIKGSGKKYTIDYTNDSTVVSRGYKETGMKHAGALVKVTFNKEDLVNGKYNSGSDANAAGVMGTIFNLHDADSDNAEKGAVDFYIIGIRDDGNYYMSKFENITDLQGNNFGANTTNDASAGEPKETEIVKLNIGVNKVTLPTNTDTNPYAYIYYRALADGSYDWAILDMTDDEAKAFEIDDFATTNSYSGTVLAHGNISDVFDACDEGKQPQNKLAVYANVYAGATLSGVWNYGDMYLEAEVIE